MSRSTVATVASEMDVCLHLGCATHEFIKGHSSLLSEEEKTVYHWNAATDFIYTTCSIKNIHTPKHFHRSTSISCVHKGRVASRHAPKHHPPGRPRSGCAW